MPPQPYNHLPLSSSEPPKAPYLRSDTETLTSSSTFLPTHPHRLLAVFPSLFVSIMSLGILRPFAFFRTYFPRLSHSSYPLRHRRSYTTNYLQNVRQRFRRLPPVVYYPIMYSLLVLSWLPVFWCFKTYYFQLMRVNGRSMYPFFNTDMDERFRRDIVGVKMLKPWERLRRGDVVVFR